MPGKNKHFIKIILMLFVIIGMSIYLDFHEKLVSFTQLYESWELDEILFVGTFFTLVYFLWHNLLRTKELKGSEKLLKFNEERYRSLIESTDDSIYLVNKNCSYLHMNKKHMQRLNINGNHFIERTYREFHSPEETNLFKEKVDNIFKTGNAAHYEYRSSRDGRYFLQSFSPVKDSEGIVNAVTVVSKDISERIKMEEELRSLSLTDQLTGLYNRRGFITLADQYLKVLDRQKQGIFLLYADLDKLKWINDELGHSEGDRAIIEAAKILRDNYRKSDIVARMGGDEFVVLPVGNTGDSIDLITSRLRKALDDINSRGEFSFKLSLSVGIAYYDPEHPCSIEELITKADKMMYEQKRKNRNSVVRNNE
jgi:diguanylate cyclase (GGDEF)-like protein/PAS domain S-box-containing protein